MKTYYITIAQTAETTLVVKAESESEAKKLAEKIYTETPGDDFQWDYDSDGEIIEIEVEE